ALRNGAAIPSMMVNPENTGDFNLEGRLKNERLREEMKRLAAANRELLERSRNKPSTLPAPVKTDVQNTPLECAESSEETHGELAPAEATDCNPDADIETLSAENAGLRARVEELEALLANSTSAEEAWQERQKEYENLLEEKSEVIRTLHM